MENKIDQNCFIITPIGDDGSSARIKAEGVYNAVVDPVLKQLDYKVIHPGRMSDAGSITNAIIENIRNSELIIANLTGLNPNVMYELAVSHTLRKRVVCIVEKGTKLPFDVSGDRFIFYDDNMYSVNSMQENLKNAINSAISKKDAEIDNPVVRAINDGNIETVLSNSDNPNKDVLRIIFDRLTSIERNTNSQNYSRIDYSDFNKEFGVKIKFGNNILSDNQITEISDIAIAHYVNLAVFVALIFDKERNILTIQNGNHRDDVIKELLNEIKYKFQFKENIEYEVYPF